MKVVATVQLHIEIPKELHNTIVRWKHRLKKKECNELYNLALASVLSDCDIKGKVCEKLKIIDADWLGAKFFSDKDIETTTKGE